MLVSALIGACPGRCLAFGQQVSIAVVGLRSCAATGTEASWVGVAVAEGLAARLTGLGTGIRQVERVDVAEVLLRQGLPPVDLNPSDAGLCKRAATAMAHLADLEGSNRTVSVADLTSGVPQARIMGIVSGRLLAATHLVVGDVVLDKPWGQGGAMLATVRVVDVSTGAIMDDSGAVARAEASVVGLQQVQCKLAAALCLALGGDVSQVDLKPHEEQADTMQLYGSARRALLESRYDEALRLSGEAWEASSVRLLPELMRTQAEAYQGAIARAKEAADQVGSEALRKQWSEKASQLLTAYDNATLVAKRQAGGAYAAAVCERAECLWSQARYSAAIPEYVEAIAHGQKTAPLYLKLGFARLLEGEYDAALADLDRFVSLRPEEGAGHSVRAVCKLLRGRPDEAVADYDTAIRIGPARAGDYLGRGTAHFIQQSYEQALGDFSQALQLWPDYVVAYVRRGVVLCRLQEYDKSILDYNRAIQLKPDSADAFANRGVAYFHKLNYAAAVADYDRAIALDPKHVTALVNRATAFCRQREYDKAIGDCTRALEIRPDFADAYSSRGVAYCENGDFALAIADHLKSVELNPTDSNCHATLAWDYYRADRLGDAARSGETAVAMDPGNPYAVGNLALIRLVSGREADAVRGYHRLLKIGARKALEAGCATDLQDLIGRQPRRTLAHFCLGLLFEGADQRAAAIEAFGAYLTSQPEGAHAPEARSRLSSLKR